MIILFFFVPMWSQENIAEGMTGDALVEYLRLNYKTSTTLGYNNARDTMYLRIDRIDGQVKGVYTNYAVDLPETGVDPSTHLYENGMNCEHVWPQSMYDENMYEGSNPMKSDLHHLRPSKSNVNSSRGNDPFAEIPDEDTDKWYKDDYYLTYIPNEYIDEYSEKSNPPNPEDERFEPIENRKGDIARSMFYFYTMYSEVADENFWQDQKEILKIWHEQDPSNNEEVIRTWSIAGYQQNKPNPFILDETLIVRAYFPDEIILPGDLNGDTILNILDVVAMVGFIMGTSDLNPPYDSAADMNEDGIVNVLDVVTLVDFILS